MLNKNAYNVLAYFLAKGNSTSEKANAKDVNGNSNPVAPGQFSFFTNMNTIRTSASNGVLLSIDESEPTLDDYTISSVNIIKTVSGSGTTPSVVVNGGTYEVTSTLSVTNTGSEPVTVKSLYCFGSNPSMGTNYLIDHTKLANPITIPAGETKVFTYTIRLDTGA